MATTYTTNYNLGKQENHADKFDMDVITDNADKIDAALTGLQSGIDGKQATLTTAQLAAVNSGITSAGVEQIETNKNNILLLEEMNGAKNLYKFGDLGATAGSGTGVTLTDNGDGTFTATGTASGANYARYLLKQAPIKAGVYIISGISGGALESYRLRVGTGSGDAYIVNLENNYAQFTIATDTTVTVQFVVNSGVTVTNLSIKPMIITKAMYDAGFTDYQPYALSNAELTEQVDFLRGKMVYSTVSNTSYTYTYTMTTNDFGGSQAGLYLIYIVSWAVTPAISIYAMAYSGGLVTNATLSKIFGTDVNISLVQNGGAYTGAVTYTGKGKIQIVAVR